jgi:hypothetical protein
MATSTSEATPLASFERINYAVRPAKSTERRMMIEAFGRLASFYPLHNYQYIGFGSTFFIDFVWLHRQYGIKHMTSVEIEENKRTRFDFNKPLSCIKMFYGSASRFLASSAINWGRPAIIWLDYDKALDLEVIADIDRVIERVKPGSFLAVTVDADPGEKSGRLATIDEAFGTSRLPDWVGGNPARLGGWSTARVFMEVMTNGLLATMLRARPDCRWKQILNFHYRDGARMLTVGGVVVDEASKDAFARCHFDELAFFRDGVDPFEIRVPNLTGPEMHRLSRELPNLTKRGRAALAKLAISDEDVADYQRLYRYLPRFIEAHA